MATLTIREFDDALKARLRVRAAEHGRSMEAEVRAILRSALVGGDGPADRLGTRTHERFSGLAGDSLELPPRSEPPRAADLGA